jgi:hypothetical protein
LCPRNKLQQAGSSLNLLIAGGIDAIAITDRKNVYRTAFNIQEKVSPFGSLAQAAKIVRDIFAGAPTCVN